MTSTFEFSSALKSAYTTLEPDEVLRAPVDALSGVTPDARTALESLNIKSVFDLATAQVFGVARRLLVAAEDPTIPEARLNVVPGDVVTPPAGVRVTELSAQPISILNALGAQAAAVAQALDVQTVRDLALWPPYRAATQLLNEVFAPDSGPGVDRDAPPDLLPKSGVYPTERVFYKKLVIDTVADVGQSPIEQAGPIDITGQLAADAGFKRMAVGAQLTFSQSWFAQGVALGQLLHSVSLAPGESTRIAMIDWSRRTRAGQTEEISESELLSNAMSHSRALSEVTSATATEFQQGSSETHVTSQTEQGGGGFGLDLGPLAVGGSGGIAHSHTDVTSASSSFGSRDLAANYAQNINDRTQQNASSVRNRRASVVKEVSEEEHEQISTRVVTNYNHMHALSIQYYEIVQAFRVSTQLERAEKCVFVPLKLLDFSNQDLLDRWHSILAAAALTDRARRQLTTEYGVVEVIPQTPRIRPGVLVGRFMAAAERMPMASATATSDGGAAPPSATPPASGDTGSTARSSPRYDRAPASSVVALLSAKGWDLDQLNTLSYTLGAALVRSGSDSVFIPDDALVLGVSLANGQAAKFSARRRDGNEVPVAVSSSQMCSFQAPVPITALDAIAALGSAESDLRTSLMLQLTVYGSVMPLSVPIVLRGSNSAQSPQDVIKFGGVKAARELVDHLQANRLHYSQAVYRALDVASIASVLSPYTYRGLPLGQVIDQTPIAVTANYLVFRLNVDVAAADHDTNDPWVTEAREWKKWLQAHGLDRPAPRSELIPLPSGGVFAEGVLGRFNAAERLDMSRFWNWQDSPIPIVASDIAPIQAGSRAQPEDVRPGQLSSPVLGIQAPTALPDPTGVAAIIGAVQNGNMFRDMSGLAQSFGLAQAALQATGQGATSAGAQASQNLSTVVSAQTERMRIAAQLAAAMIGGPAGAAAAGAAGNGSRSPNNVSEEGARLNYAKNMDDRGATGDTAGAASDTSSANAGSGESSADSGSDSGLESGGDSGATSTQPMFAASDESKKPSIERDTFDLLSGRSGTALAKDALDLAYAGPGGGGGKAAATKKPKARDVVLTMKFTQGRFDALGANVEVKVWSGRKLTKKIWDSGDWKPASDVKSVKLRAVVETELTVAVAVRAGGADPTSDQPAQTYRETYVIPISAKNTANLHVAAELKGEASEQVGTNVADAKWKAETAIRARGYFTVNSSAAPMSQPGHYRVVVSYFTKNLILESTGEVYQ